MSTKIRGFVAKSVKKHGDFLISILQDIQKRFNYLPEEVLKEVAEQLKISLRDVYGVASFYNSFSFAPKGKHIMTVCMGTACHIRGGERIVEALSKKLNIEPGGTTKDLQYTLETVNCLGCCAIGPIVVVDGEYHGEMNPQRAIKCACKKQGGKND